MVLIQHHYNMSFAQSNPHQPGNPIPLPCTTFRIWHLRLPRLNHKNCSVWDLPDRMQPVFCVLLSAVPIILASLDFQSRLLKHHEGDNPNRHRPCPPCMCCHPHTINQLCNSRSLRPSIDKILYSLGLRMGDLEPKTSRRRRCRIIHLHCSHRIVCPKSTSVQLRRTPRPLRRDSGDDRCSCSRHQKNLCRRSSCWYFVHLIGDYY